MGKLTKRGHGQCDEAEQGTLCAEGAMRVSGVLSVGVHDMMVVMPGG